MIYHVDWYLDNGVWKWDIPFEFDNYEVISLMEILRDNPKLWFNTLEGNC